VTNDRLGRLEKLKLILDAVKARADLEVRVCSMLLIGNLGGMLAIAARTKDFKLDSQQIDGFMGFGYGLVLTGTGFLISVLSSHPLIQTIEKAVSTEDEKKIERRKAEAWSGHAVRIIWVLAGVLFICSVGLSSFLMRWPEH